MDKLVPLNSLFHVKYGNQIDKNKQEICSEGINFVSRKSHNLGVDGKIKEISYTKPFPSGLITVSLGGSILSTFIQQAPFYTGQNIKVLTPIEKMTFQTKLFYCHAISMNRFRYTSHGREANITLDNLLVPPLSRVPKWINDIHVEPPSIKPLSNKSTILPPAEKWKKFDISELFFIEKTIRTTQDDMDKTAKGKYPYIKAKATDNGAEGHYDFFTEKGNVITVDSAVIGFAAYQQDNFSSSGDVVKLIPKFNMNPYLAMFFTVIFNKEQYRYNYGRKAGQTRLKQAHIKLPTIPDSTPDFTLMENYIKSLEYSSSL